MPGESFPRFCRDLRIRLKDARTHRHAVATWPDLLAVEAMDREALLALRQARLERLVAHVAAHVPLYAAWAARSGWRPGDPLRIGDLPIVSQDEHRAEPDAFVARNAPRTEMWTARTSGSTGTPFRSSCTPSPRT